MSTQPPIRLIVGLGNPGPEYVDTRHNVGFWILDALANEHGVRFSADSKCQGQTARLRLDEGDVWLLKPQTFMNRSGLSVVALANYYKITPAEILVFHDELDLLPGMMKLKLGGGNAGHNGLKDISQQLGTPQFWRARVGIGHPRSFGWTQQVADFVLANPSREHLDAMGPVIESCLKMVPLVVEGNFQRALRLVSKHQKSPLQAPKPEANAPKTPDNEPQA